MNKQITCSECGAVLAERYMYNFEDHYFCEECLSRCTTICDYCGERIWRHEVEGDCNYTLCPHCYEHSYTTCEECGRLMHNDDAFYSDVDDYPYCRDCFENLNNDSIKNYSYKPEPIFYGSGDLFYGIELEIDNGGEDCANAQKLLDIANEVDTRIYCKRDGSLNNGFEIVSHPMSLDYHTSVMIWEEILKKAVDMDYLSHSAHGKTCGLHIHVSRSAFGEDSDQEEAIGRVIFFVEKHWNELVKFSRRTLVNLNRWAAKYATISPTTEETYKKAKEKRMGRYVAVNLGNADTIEFRIFRGTLRYKTFLATLQLVDEICNCAITMTDREMETMSWLDFVQRIPTKKTALIEYLKEKRLYVNENVTESEDM